MADEQNNIVERLGNFAETWHRLYGMNTKVMDEAADEIERLRKYEAGIKDLASTACLGECDRHDRLRLSGICAPCWARRIELSDG